MTTQCLGPNRAKNAYNISNLKINGPAKMTNR